VETPGAFGGGARGACRRFRAVSGERLLQDVSAMVNLKLKSPLEEGYPSTGRRKTEGNPQGGPVVGNPDAPKKE